MAHKKFIYKPSAVDQFIMAIILLACLAFGGLLYLDYSNKLPTDVNQSSAEVQQLQLAEQQLRAELERVRNEGAEN